MDLAKRYLAAAIVFLAAIRKVAREFTGSTLTGDEQPDADGALATGDGGPVDVVRRPRETYREILDATKHLDDKIGRYVTAVAFLVTGAIIVLAQAIATVSGQQLFGARYKLEGGTELPLIAICLGAFLILAMLAVIFYLLATGAPLTIPTRRSGRHRRPDDRSMLFYHDIARHTERSWAEAWKREHGELDQILRNQYIRESLNIARRVDVKYARTLFGTALIIWSIEFFLLATVFVIPVLGWPQEGARAWEWPVWGAVAAVLSVYTAIIIVQRLRHMLMFEEKSDLHGRFRWMLGLTATFHALYAFATVTVAPADWFDTSVVALAAGAIALGAGVAYFLLFWRSKEKDVPDDGSSGVGSSQRSLAWKLVISSAVVALLTGALLWHQWYSWQLLLTVVVAASPLLGTPVDTRSKFNKVMERRAATETESVAS